MDSKEIGKFLQSKRKEKSITQAELATLIGVTHQAVSRWETGESIPEVTMLDQLSKTYNVTIDQIIHPNSIHAYKETKDDINSVNNTLNIVSYSLYGLSAMFYLLMALQFGNWRIGFMIANMVLLTSGFIIGTIQYTSKTKTIIHIKRYSFDILFFSTMVITLISFYQVTSLLILFLLLFVAIVPYIVIHQIILNVLLKVNNMEPVSSYRKNDSLLLVTILLSLFTYFNTVYSLESFHINNMLAFGDSYRSLAIDYGWFIFIGLTLFLISLSYNLFIKKERSVKLLFKLITILYAILLFFNILSILPNNPVTHIAWSVFLHRVLYLLLGLGVILLLIKEIYNSKRGDGNKSLLINILGIILMIVILISRGELMYTEYDRISVYDVGFTRYSLFGLILCSFSYNVVLLNNTIKRFYKKEEQLS